MTYIDKKCANNFAAEFSVAQCKLPTDICYSVAQYLDENAFVKVSALNHTMRKGTLRNICLQLPVSHALREIAEGAGKWAVSVLELQRLQELGKIDAAWVRESEQLQQTLSILQQRTSPAEKVDALDILQALAVLVPYMPSQEWKKFALGTAMAQSHYAHYGIRVAALRVLMQLAAHDMPKAVDAMQKFWLTTAGAPMAMWAAGRREYVSVLAECPIYTQPFIMQAFVACTNRLQQAFNGFPYLQNGNVLTSENLELAWNLLHHIGTLLPYLDVEQKRLATQLLLHAISERQTMRGEIWTPDAQLVAHFAQYGDANLMTSAIESTLTAMGEIARFTVPAYPKQEPGEEVSFDIDAHLHICDMVAEVTDAHLALLDKVEPFALCLHAPPYADYFYQRIVAICTAIVDGNPVQAALQALAAKWLQLMVQMAPQLNYAQTNFIFALAEKLELLDSGNDTNSGAKIKSLEEADAAVDSLVTDALALADAKMQRANQNVFFTAKAAVAKRLQNVNVAYQVHGRAPSLAAAYLSNHLARPLKYNCILQESVVCQVPHELSNQQAYLLWLNAVIGPHDTYVYPDKLPAQHLAALTQSQIDVLSQIALAWYGASCAGHTFNNLAFLLSILAPCASASVKAQIHQWLQENIFQAADADYRLSSHLGTGPELREVAVTVSPRANPS